MEKVEASKSRWAMFVTSKIIRRLNDSAAAEWQGAGLQFMTYTEMDDKSYQYYIKASKALRKSKWNSFVKMVGGHTLTIFKANKYNNPIEELRGSPREAEARENTFTIEMNPNASPPAAQKKSKKSKHRPGCAVVDLFRKRLDDFMRQPGILWHVAAKTFGPEWEAEECADLQAYSQLEAHRRVLGLEAFLVERRVGWEAHAALRAEAFRPGKYLIIDPLTLCFPFFVSFLGGASSIREHATYRLRAVAACILPVLRYGEALTAMLPDGDAGAAEAWAFRQPFAFLPPSLRRAVAAGVDDAVARRCENERRELADALAADKIPSDSELVRLHARVCERWGLALAAHAVAATRALPPTPSLADAAYDVAAFLA